MWTAQHPLFSALSLEQQFQGNRKVPINSLLPITVPPFLGLPVPKEQLGLFTSHIAGTKCSDDYIFPWKSLI